MVSGDRGHLVVWRAKGRKKVGDFGKGKLPKGTGVGEWRMAEGRAQPPCSFSKASATSMGMLGMCVMARRENGTDRSDLDGG